ncbi:gluconate 2-dehydrogenase subunit 3 family protein [Telluria mixta]|uniref:Gluconate 2-dehydrogenase subunit 3 family protein n=1 Tax=Telluria mixta TaxID=34071 RepID=A0ABT2C055_9BURK|nr:gluconate 2-dehydrogenase subunit 3 family protein [Telluria mixta]MCS0630226.1 gluconate 2-dehydrogenase subunit 3 family protein [Telluria mixta]WEM94466.1 gluconate 2-dehydrogenase subunit 3 family protein [Telluria mixta]
MSAERHWSRRDFGRALALLATLTGAPALAAGTARPPARGRAMMREVCQLVIPRTGTPGAGDAGVGDFVLLALAYGHGAPGDAEWLQDELDRRAGGAWLGKPSRVRAATLAALDAEAYPARHGSAPPSPWHAIKGLILTGYYTSQAGATHELRYAFTPGRFDPDLPLKPGEIGWSSDWNAIDFG